MKKRLWALLPSLAACVAGGPPSSDQSKPYLNGIETVFDRGPLPVVLVGDFNLDPASKNKDGSLKNADTLAAYEEAGLSSVVPWTHDTFYRKDVIPIMATVKIR